jgi:hypothetical protein
MTTTNNKHHEEDSNAETKNTVISQSLTVKSQPPIKIKSLNPAKIYEHDFKLCKANFTTTAQIHLQLYKCVLFCPHGVCCIFVNTLLFTETDMHLYSIVLPASKK